MPVIALHPMSFCRSAVTLVLAAILATAVHGQPAAADPPRLLLPAPAAADSSEETRRNDRVAQISAEEGVRATRLMRLNRKALSDLAANLSSGGGLLRVNVGPDAMMTLRIRRVEKDRLGFIVYEGRIEDDSLSAFNLVLRDGVASGTIDARGRFFRVTHVEGDIVAVVDVDRSVFPNEAQPIVPLIAATTSSERAKTEGASQFNVMIVYTAAARKSAGSVSQIQADARLGVSQINTALANSAQNVSVNMTGLFEVPYTETGNPQTDLNWLRQDPQVAKLRSSWQADDVGMFLSKMDDACGLGYLMSPVSTGFAAYAFNVTKLSCATSGYSYAHETGHNIGATHDRANANGPGAYPYSYGYQAPNRAFRTILAYNCSGGDCPRKLYYSNPEVSLSGQPTGIDPTAANSADNALTIAKTAPTVALFHATLPSNTFGDFDLNSNPGFAGIDPGATNMPAFLVDVNLDSRADYCRFVGTTPNIFLSCAFATATGFGNYNLNSGAGTANFDPGVSTMPRFMADVNADKRADYCRFVGTTPNIFLSCAFATATGFGNYDLNSGAGMANLDPGYDTMGRFFADVNADNRADFCRFVGGSPYIFLSCALATPSGFGNYDVSSGQGANFDLGYGAMPRLMADVNGDNRADYCRFAGTDPNIYFSCALATGTGFGNHDLNSGQGVAKFDSGISGLPIALADVNADRRADYCRFVGAAPYQFLSCALAAATTFGNYDVNSPILYDEGRGTLLRTMADVNADQKADYCRFVVGTPDIYLSCGFATVSP